MSSIRLDFFRQAANMPIVPKAGPDEAGFQFYFVSGNCIEASHVHVRGRAKGGVKYWLDPLRLEHTDYRSRQVNADIARIVRRRAAEFYQEWIEHCGGAS